MMFMLTREHELVFRDLEFAAGPGSTQLARLIIETSPAPDPPPEVAPPGSDSFTVTLTGTGELALEWESAPGCDSYRLVAGDLTSMALSGGVTPLNAAPVLCGISDVVTLIPAPAGSIFLLVAGENAGGIGSLGSGDAGPRAADPTCP
jgi:hypothetical protein